MVKTGVVKTGVVEIDVVIEIDISVKIDIVVKIDVVIEIGVVIGVADERAGGHQHAARHESQYIEEGHRSASGMVEGSIRLLPWTKAILQRTAPHGNVPRGHGVGGGLRGRPR